MRGYLRLLAEAFALYIFIPEFSLNPRDDLGACGLRGRDYNLCIIDVVSETQRIHNLHLAGSIRTRAITMTLRFN